ncbi:hypothetical protein PR048_027489 [Dryococelus australis]|uniref:Uncharacterized protein n=1 Tax=Dryococelus australis TaxID=614101 RepID=A0ABQ9GGJ4_9NEOP|nr:hypothetical protein PR048_027489 [Dryococelus australis]
MSLRLPAYGLTSALTGVHPVKYLSFVPGATVAERLDCFPPTKANRIQCAAGSLRIFRKWKSCRTMPLIGGFSRGSPVPRPFIPALLHTHLNYPHRLSRSLGINLLPDSSSNIGSVRGQSALMCGLSTQLSHAYKRHARHVLLHQATNMPRGYRRRKCAYWLRRDISQHRGFKAAKGDGRVSEAAAVTAFRKFRQEGGWVRAVEKFSRQFNWEGEEGINLAAGDEWRRHDASHRWWLSPEEAEESDSGGKGCCGRRLKGPQVFSQPFSLPRERSLLEIGSLATSAPLCGFLTLRLSGTPNSMGASLIARSPERPRHSEALLKAVHVKRQLEEFWFMKHGRRQRERQRNGYLRPQVNGCVGQGGDEGL